MPLCFAKTLTCQAHQFYNPADPSDRQTDVAQANGLLFTGGPLKANLKLDRTTSLSPGISTVCTVHPDPIGLSRAGKRLTTPFAGSSSKAPSAQVSCSILSPQRSSILHQNEPAMAEPGNVVHRAAVVLLALDANHQCKRPFCSLQCRLDLEYLRRDILWQIAHSSLDSGH